MPALEGQFLKEISVRFAGENHLRTQKTHKTKLRTEAPERPLPKDPFFQLLIQKHFKTVAVTVILGKINSNDFQDGNWKSMEMKG